MRVDQQIRIDHLLLEREEQFVHVHDLERRAAAILGEPYPFTRPSLPSDQKAKKKSAAPRASSTASIRDQVRKLEEDESAFRVTYVQFGKTVTEEHDDPEALRTLLASQSAQMKVVRIETLDTGGEPRAVLFTAGG